MTLDELIQEWFDARCSHIGEFSGNCAEEMIQEHRRACLVALELGASPPDASDWLIDYIIFADD